MQTIDFENGDFFMQRSGDELTRHPEPWALLTKMADSNVEELRRLTVARTESVYSALTNNSADIDDVLEEVEQILKVLNTIDSVVRLSEDIFRDILSAKRILEHISTSRSRTPKNNSGVPGRPSYSLTQQQLRALIDVGFNVGQIAEMLQVSKSTIERRLMEFGISTRSYCEITNDELDAKVQEIKLFHPNIGSKNLAGYLAARNIKIPRHRIRESLQRVDPLGVAARKCKAIHRRVYSVSRPLALWHFDGNHKLIRWRLVVHGCVDGFSRIPVYLICHTNNQASTVLQSFLGAVHQWGLPSRVRCDMGGENIDVVEYMINRRGTDRGSALVGRSVHNQRIERLWRDVYHNVLDIFHGIFMSMEDIGMLDPINEIDLWCLHYCFCNVINRKLKSWVNAWIRHPLSSEQNQTPLQLWVRGQFDNAERLNVDQADAVVRDDYGIDWDGPASADAYTDGDVHVADTNCPLQEDQFDELTIMCEQNVPENPSPWECVRNYQLVKNFTLQHT